VSKIEPGVEVQVRHHRIESARSTNHLHVEAREAASRRLLASALSILSDRRTTDGHTESLVPAPAPDSLPSRGLAQRRS
jgi:hypothetical protein